MIVKCSGNVTETLPSLKLESKYGELPVLTIARPVGLKKYKKIIAAQKNTAGDYYIYEGRRIFGEPNGSLPSANYFSFKTQNYLQEIYE